MKNTRFLTLIGMAVIGTALSATSANAFTFSYNAGNSTPGTFSYDVNLDAGANFRHRRSSSPNGFGRSYRCRF